MSTIHIIQDCVKAYVKVESSFPMKDKDTCTVEWGNFG